jgi:hypothetical protein
MRSALATDLVVEDLLSRCISSAAVDHDDDDEIFDLIPLLARLDLTSLARQGYQSNVLIKELAYRLRERGRVTGAVGHANPTPPSPNSFRRQGKTWSLTFKGKSASLPHLKGLSYIAELLRTPRKLIEAETLCTATEQTKPMEFAGIQQADSKAIKAVSRALVEKQAALNALPENESSKREELHKEISFYREYLGRSTGLYGRARKAASTAERARLAVTNAIHRAINAISEAHPELGQHLKKSIRTGTELIYLPSQDPGWQF